MKPWPFAALFRAVLPALALAASMSISIVVASPASAQSDATAVPESGAQIRLSFAPLVKQVAPAVVNLVATRQSRRTTVPSLFDDPFFRRFFGAPDTQRTPQQSLGSGVIVDADGLIVTNNHVIEGATSIKVVLADRREFDATIARTDPDTDLAVLSIDAPGPLPHLTLADSDDLEVGDLVLAIGNPFGVGQTVTSGIVSALARTNVGITDFNFFIQTDAAINPGNSGGALVTTGGQLAGVNTAIFSRSSGSQGVGFAVPANMVRTVIDSVGTNGIVRRPWLGAEAQDVTAEIAESLGLPRPAGALVNAVHPTGPAAAAGIQPGDVIRAVAGREVADAGALKFRLATGALGTTIPITVVRDGEPFDVELALQTAPEDPPRDVTRLSGNHPFAGAAVANLSPALAEELEVSTLATGVIVIDVQRGSPAGQVGLRPGDIVADVNGTAIDTVTTLVNATNRRASAWRLTVRRGGRQLQVTVSG